MCLSFCPSGCLASHFPTHFYFLHGIELQFDVFWYLCSLFWRSVRVQCMCACCLHQTAPIRRRKPNERIELSCAGAILKLRIECKNGEAAASQSSISKRILFVWVKLSGPNMEIDVDTLCTSGFVSVFICACAVLCGSEGRLCFYCGIVSGVHRPAGMDCSFGDWSAKRILFGRTSFSAGGVQCQCDILCTLRSHASSRKYLPSMFFFFDCLAAPRLQHIGPRVKSHFVSRTRRDYIPDSRQSSIKLD